MGERERESSRKVKSHCFHQGPVKKPLRDFRGKKLEKYVL